MSNSKKQMCIENDNEMDYISKLPDVLLCHILSFVPTKSAVVTGILSRRWSSLWTKVPILDFTERPKYAKYFLNDFAKKNFKSFVDKVLLQNDQLRIQQLRFGVFSDLNIVWANSLINALLKRDISEIYLSKGWPPGLDKAHIHLPMDLFIRERLRVLKLRGPFDIHMPSNLHLPRLETLHIYELNVLGDNVLKIVTSGCSALEELVIEFGHIRIIDVASLTLKRLKIIGVRYETIVVKAPAVRDFVLDTTAENYCIGELSSLIEARIQIAGKHSQALELMRRISHVRILHLKKSTVDLFGGFGDAGFPKFPNLTVLEIQISENMLHMLKCGCPNLMHLIVDVGPALNDESGQFLTKTTPLCLSWIPTIEIRDFGGFIDDTALVRYLLENAETLKELKLHMHKISKKRERNAFKELLSFTRVSRTCQVIVCSSCEYTTFFFTSQRTSITL